MQDLSTTSILALFETDKAQRLSFVQDLIYRLEEGNADPLTVHLQVKAMEEIIKLLTDRSDKNKNAALAKRYCELLLDRAQNQGGKTFDYQNAKFEIKETGSKYDYSVCNDPEYMLLWIAAEKTKERLKEKEEFLKALPVKGLELVDKETGEAYTVYPPAKSSTTSVTVTLK